jgi:hypothetical protein
MIVLIANSTTPPCQQNRPFYYNMIYFALHIHNNIYVVMAGLPPGDDKK